MMASNKRKGRTRIKLDAKKIALAKQLIMREATTTVIANELNISRTFAWRLRKSLVNGVSLHERVIEPTADEQQQQQLQEEQNQQLLAAAEFPHIKMANIKPEKLDEEEIGPTKEKIFQQQSYLDETEPHGPLPLLVNSEPNTSANDTSVEENGRKEQQDLQSEENNANKMPDVEQKELAKHQKNATDGLNLYSLHHSQEQFLKNMVAHAQRENVIVANGGGVDFEKHLKNNVGLPQLPLLNFPPAVAAAINHLPVNLSIRPIASMQKMETSSYKKLNNNNMISSTSSSPGATSMTSMSAGGKKPRKPNVFIDDEKYAMAKVLVAQNASTMEIARALNVSQMTAWKVRDAIVKGLPLSYRNKRERDMQRNPVAMLYNRHDDVMSSGGSDNGSVGNENKLLYQQQQQQQLQHHHDELQRQKQQQQQQQLQQQHLKLLQRQQQQQRLLHQEQQQQQRLLQKEQQKQQLKLQQQQQQQINKTPLSLSAIPAIAAGAVTTASTTTTLPTSSSPSSTASIEHATTQLQQPAQPSPTQPQQQEICSIGHKRRRLKAAEREMRDKEITREILELIKEDSNIQYWKVSARLAEKGYPISPSSVCQKLKSMGIHRRWKFADKPKPLMDVEHLKVAAAAAAVAAAGLPANSSLHDTGVIMSEEVAAAAAAAVAANFEPSQFHMGGAHFLSAFTR